jgi:hypothetical protein
VYGEVPLAVVIIADPLLLPEQLTGAELLMFADNNAGDWLITVVEVFEQP